MKKSSYCRLENPDEAVQLRPPQGLTRESTTARLYFIAGTTFDVIRLSTASDVTCAASLSNLFGFGPSNCAWPVAAKVFDTPELNFIPVTTTAATSLGGLLLSSLVTLTL